MPSISIAPSSTEGGIRGGEQTAASGLAATLGVSLVTSAMPNFVSSHMEEYSTLPPPPPLRHTHQSFQDDFDGGEDERSLSSSFSSFFSSLSSSGLSQSALPSDATSASSWSTQQVFVVLAVTVLVPFIIGSNVLVLVSVARYKRLQVAANYFIVSLALVDLLVAFVTPFAIAMHLIQMESAVIRLAAERVLMTVCGVSVLTLAAIAYDRHTALVRPLTYVSTVTPKKILLLVLALWLWATAVVWTPLLLGWYHSEAGAQSYLTKASSGGERGGGESVLDEDFFVEDRNYDYNLPIGVNNDYDYKGEKLSWLSSSPPSPLSSSSTSPSSTFEEISTENLRTLVLPSSTSPLTSSRSHKAFVKSSLVRKRHDAVWTASQMTGERTRDLVDTRDEVNEKEGQSQLLSDYETAFYTAQDDENDEEVDTEQDVTVYDNTQDYSSKLSEKKNLVSPEGKKLVSSEGNKLRTSEKVAVNANTPRLTRIFLQRNHEHRHSESENSGKRPSEQGKPTAIQWPLELLHHKAHALFLCAIFGPAWLAITVCYFRIYTVARHHARAIAAVESSVQHNMRFMRFVIRDARPYARTLALVIGVFLVLWTPYLACLLAHVLSGGGAGVTSWVWTYLTLLAVLNSGLNPWVYAFKNNEFRAAFRKVLRTAFSRRGVCCGLRVVYDKVWGKSSSSLSASRIVKDGARRQSSLTDAYTFATNTTFFTAAAASLRRMSRFGSLGSRLGSVTRLNSLTRIGSLTNLGGSSTRIGGTVSPFRGRSRSRGSLTPGSLTPRESLTPGSLTPLPCVVDDGSEESYEAEEVMLQRTGNGRTASLGGIHSDASTPDYTGMHTVASALDLHPPSSATARSRRALFYLGSSSDSNSGLGLGGGGLTKSASAILRSPSTRESVAEYVNRYFATKSLHLYNSDDEDDEDDNDDDNNNNDNDDNNNDDDNDKAEETKKAESEKKKLNESMDDHIERDHSDSDDGLDQSSETFHQNEQRLKTTSNMLTVTADNSDHSDYHSDMGDVSFEMDSYRLELGTPRDEATTLAAAKQSSDRLGSEQNLCTTPENGGRSSQSVDISTNSGIKTSETFGGNARRVSANDSVTDKVKDTLTQHHNESQKIAVSSFVNRSTSASYCIADGNPAVASNLSSVRSISRSSVNNSSSSINSSSNSSMNSTSDKNSNKTSSNQHGLRTNLQFYRSNPLMLPVTHLSRHFSETAPKALSTISSTSERSSDSTLSDKNTTSSHDLSLVNADSRINLQCGRNAESNDVCGRSSSTVHSRSDPRCNARQISDSIQKDSNGVPNFSNRVVHHTNGVSNLSNGVENLSNRAQPLINSVPNLPESGSNNCSTHTTSNFAYKARNGHDTVNNFLNHTNCVRERADAINSNGNACDPTCCLHSVSTTDSLRCDTISYPRNRSDFWNSVHNLPHSSNCQLEFANNNRYPSSLTTDTQHSIRQIRSCHEFTYCVSAGRAVSCVDEDEDEDVRPHFDLMDDDEEDEVIGVRL